MTSLRCLLSEVLRFATLKAFLADDEIGMLKVVYLI
jgi:hypothetical protein